MGAHKGSVASNRIDLNGQRFGKLQVTGNTLTRGKVVYWEVTCECGRIVWRRSQQLRCGYALHCGCARRPTKVTHGMSGTQAYQSWLGMKGRCADPNNKAYGAKGIRVCERWNNSFEDFLADMGIPDHGMSIERIDNDLGYEPSNCRWATRKEQAQNRSVSRVFEWKGRHLNLAELARATNINYTTLYKRLVTYGWPVEDAVIRGVQ